jgi:DNA-binding response OmpR family regulator
MTPEETRPTILIAEDDPGTRRYLGDQLTADDCDVVSTDDARGALRALATKFPDLLLLDITLAEGTSGLDVLRAVRAADRSTSTIDPYIPILMLSGRSRTTERVRAMELGADAYLCKPFAYAEVRSHIRALLRRANGRDRTARIRIGPLEIDPSSRTAWLSGHNIRLTSTEFALLRALAISPSTVRTKNELTRAVWGIDGRTSSRTLDSHICRLRAKLRTPETTFIHNSWGIGYRLIDNPTFQPLPEPNLRTHPREPTHLLTERDPAHLVAAHSAAQPAERRALAAAGR